MSDADTSPETTEHAAHDAAATASDDGSDRPTDLASTKLFVRYDEGEGPVIVYLHGINSDASDWRKVIDYIGSGYRHIAVDLLGFGESPKPHDISYNADEHALVVDNTLRELCIDQPFLLVGYSLGGDIAIRYASTYPEKLRRLFLLSAPFYLPPAYYDPQGFGTKFLMQMALQWAWRFVGGAKKHNALLYQIADGKMQEAAKQFLRTDDVPAHWDIMSKNLENTIAAATFVDDLPALTMPVTFAMGVRDVIVQPDQTPALKSLKPDMEIRRIVGLNADHFMLVGLPDKVAEEIMRDEIRTLHVALDKGSGPPILLLHGLSSRGKDWKPVAESLSATNRVVALDLLGFGESPHSETLLYTLQDHAVGVMNTMRTLFGGGERVTMVGEGLGANVALAVSSDLPLRVERVVAIAPTLIPPDWNADTARVASRDNAETLAAVEALQKLSDDSNAERVASDKLVRRVLPLTRSIKHAVLRVDADALLRKQSRPVDLVIPQDDIGTNMSDYLIRIADREPSVFTVTRAPGDDDFTWKSPADAVAIIAPENSTATARAATARPVRRSKATTVLDAVRSVENQLVLRGVVEILAGLFVLSLQNLHGYIIEFGFAAWVIWEGAYSIFGSLGLRREKKGWRSYFLVGVLVLGVGLFLMLNQQTGTGIIALIIALRAIYVGIANIIVARAAGTAGTPKPLWLIYLQAALGLAVGLSIIFVPEFGGRLLKWVLGGYLVLSGGLVLGTAIQSKRAARRQIRRMLVDTRAEVASVEKLERE